MSSATCSACGAPLGPAGCPAGHVQDPLDAFTVPMTGAAAAQAELRTEPGTAPGAVTASGAATRVVADPMLPDVLDGYRVDYVAGTGGMATVYRAHDEQLGTPVAIKVLKRSAMNDPRAAERALREATAAAVIHHPGVAPLLRHGLLPDGRPWLATPFFEGAPLDRLLAERGALPWQLAVPVLDEVAAALGAAHAAGVVHRDVKPGNVFCAKLPDGSVAVKLLDFGLALLGDAEEGIPQTSVQSAAGTADFVAPEQALGRDLDARADLYALGITAFQLLTGRLPFSSQTSTAVMRRQVFEQAPRVRDEADVPAKLDALVAALLAKQPKARPASAAAVREALDRLRFPAPRAAAGDGLLEAVARQWAARHPPSLLQALFRRAK